MLTFFKLFVYSVQLNIFEIKKLEKLGIQYTTDPKKAGQWVKHVEHVTQRDFGGIMIKEPKYAIRLSIPWDNLQEIKESSIEASEKGGRSI